MRDLYLQVGIGYQDVVLQPTTRSALRNVVANHEAKSLYVISGGVGGPSGNGIEGSHTPPRTRARARSTGNDI